MTFCGNSIYGRLNVIFLLCPGLPSVLFKVVQLEMCVRFSIPVRARWHDHLIIRNLSTTAIMMMIMMQQHWAEEWNKDAGVFYVLWQSWKSSGETGCIVPTLWEGGGGGDGVACDGNVKIGTDHGAWRRGEGRIRQEGWRSTVSGFDPWVPFHFRCLSAKQWLLFFSLSLSLFFVSLFLFSLRLLSSPIWLLHPLDVCVFSYFFPLNILRVRLA